MSAATRLRRGPLDQWLLLCPFSVRSESRAEAGSSRPPPPPLPPAPGRQRGSRRRVSGDSGVRVVRLRYSERSLSRRPTTPGSVSSQGYENNNNNMDGLSSDFTSASPFISPVDWHRGLPSGPSARGRAEITARCRVSCHYFSLSCVWLRYGG